MKKSSIWKASGVVLASVALLLLGACGKSSGASKSGSNSKTMQILLSEEPEKGDALNAALQKWAKESGNKVDEIVIPYDDQRTKFPSMVKNHDVPDLVSTTFLTQLFPDEFVNLSKKIDTTKFDQTALKIVSQNYNTNKVLEVPNQYTITCYYVNKDAFKKAGIAVPSENDPWTLNELYENAAKLKKNGGVKYGLAVDFSRARYDNLMYSNGGSMTERSGKKFKVAINSDKNVKTLNQFVKANESGVMPKVIWTGGSSDNPLDYFKNGDVGIYMSGSWSYTQLKNEVSDFKFAVMPSPKGSVQQSAITGGAGLAIPKDAKNSKLALSFIKWLYKKDNYLEYIKNDHGLSFIKGWDYKSNDAQTDADYKLMHDEMSNVSKQFLVDEESEWRTWLDNEYRDAIKNAVSGEVTAKQTLDTFAKSLSEKSGWKIE
ncbi:extracellular solute-binding protein [Lacticaseibacillus jixiensis]|uniref:extracellular solute-binding protein n=1 Tax=Lacticaseibacillus jixiensis TaxID=3231926 RepID=UPI0036F1E16A